MSMLLERELRVSESVARDEAGVSGGVSGRADFVGGEARSREPRLGRAAGGKWTVDMPVD
jgi:hypothetical protein